MAPSIVAVIATVAVLAAIVILVVVLIKKYVRVRKTLVDQEELLMEVGNLNREVIKLNNEKERILAMKVSQLGLNPVKARMTRTARRLRKKRKTVRLIKQPTITAVSTSVLRLTSKLRTMLLPILIMKSHFRKSAKGSAILLAHVSDFFMRSRSSDCSFPRLLQQDL